MDNIPNEYFHRRGGKMNGVSPKKIRRIFWIAILVTIVLGFVGVFTGWTFLTTVMEVLFILDIVFYILCYRCPHCGRHLGRRGGSFCPYCGEEFG